MKYLLLLAFSVILLSCRKEGIRKTEKDNEKKVSITTGVWGTVSCREGNCMPGVGPSKCKENPVQRTVRIYAYTLLSQATVSQGDSRFYDAFSTPLIKETEADSQGFFQAELAPGQYTLTVIENGKLYANQFEGTPSNLAIQPFTVSNGSVLKKNILIDYKAAY